MIDLDQYQISCGKLLDSLKRGRGGIYLGGFDILGANLFGHQLIIDSRHSPSLKMLYVPPPVETSILALMIHLLKRGMVCVDVGAGCGYYSVLMAVISGKNGKVYSFEPIPECFRLLQKNLEMNILETVTCVNCIVSDSQQRQKKSYFGGNYQFFFLSEVDQKERVLEMESVSLDHYFYDKETSIDFIKINFEKELPQVFRGMKEIIKFNKAIKILCLFNKEKILERDVDPAEFLEEVASKNFSIFLLPSLEVIEKEELLEFNTTKNILLARQ